VDDEAPETTGVPIVFSAGSQIAGYRLETQIGHGGMAVVFRARDERLQRQVALKILSPALAADESFRHRFIRESRSAAAVDHPHIIPVFEAGDANGVLFLAMRYVPGGDAGTLIRQVGPLPAARAIAAIAAVASALDAAHAAGLVHRDVKPANMLMDSRPGHPDHVYLSDFGITKGALSSAGLTGTGNFLGTLDYAAPEQIEGGKVDARTDEYALACAAVELLSGEPPFPRDEGMAVLYAQLSASPPLLTSRRIDLPTAADDVLLRALAKSPGERYASCGEFAAALRIALGLPQYDPDYGWAVMPDHPATEVSGARGQEHGGTDGTHDAIASARTGEPAPDTGQTLTSAGRRRPSDESVAPVQPSRDGRLRRTVMILAGIAAVAAGCAVGAVILTGNTGKTPIDLANSQISSSGRAAASRPAVATAGPSPRSASSSPRASTPATSQAIAQQDYTVIRSLTDPGTAAHQIDSVAFSADGATLLAGDMDGAACLWSTGTGQQIKVFRGGGAKVFAVALSPDGTMAAAAGKDGTSFLWQTATGNLIASIPDPGGSAVNTVAFSPDGKTLATGDSAGNTYLWNVSDTSRPAATLTDPAGSGVWALAFSPDGKILATGDFTGNTSLWNLTAATSAPVRTFTVPGSQYVTAVAFSPDGKTLATGNYNGTTYLWDAGSGSHTVITEPGIVWAVAISRNGTLAIGDDNGSTYLEGLTTARQEAVLTDPATGGQGVGAIAFSPDGRTLAAGDTDGTTFLWRIS